MQKVKELIESVFDGTHPMYNQGKVIAWSRSLKEQADKYGVYDPKKSIKQLMNDIKLAKEKETTMPSNETYDGYGPLNNLSANIYKDNVLAGWWSDLATGAPKDRNVGELLMLVVSEVAEAMEGYRKNLPDDKLPHRKMFEVELADVVIRICDIAGHFSLDLDGAIQEKREYNKTRADHQKANRMGENGKKF